MPKTNLPTTRVAATARMQAVAREVFVAGKDGKRKAVSKALLDNGYAPSTAKNPKQVTRTKTWQDLMKKYIGKEKLAKVHDELLQASISTERPFPPEFDNKRIKAAINASAGCKLLFIHPVYVVKDAIRDKDGNLIEPERKVLVQKIAYFTAPNTKARDLALDKGYKLQGDYAAEKSVNTNINLGLSDLRKMREAGEVL